MVVTFDDVACYSLYAFDRLNKKICQEKYQLKGGTEN